MPHPPKYGDWNHLELCLHEGEFASYTIRELTLPEEMDLEFVSREGAVLEITYRDQKHTIGLEPSEDPGIFQAAVIEAGEDTQVSIRCLAGSVTLKMIAFRRV